MMRAIPNFHGSMLNGVDEIDWTNRQTNKKIYRWK